MAHLLRPEGAGLKSCDICGKGTKRHKIHDRDRCEWIHGDKKVHEAIRNDLKIASSAVGSFGNAMADLVKGSRMAYKGYTGVPRTGAPKSSCYKVGGKTTAGLHALGGAVTLTTGILDIVAAIGEKSPQDRCSTCDKTFLSPGCQLFCLACNAVCRNNSWRDGSANEEDEDKCCYEICPDCFSRLVGS